MYGSNKVISNIDSMRASKLYFKSEMERYHQKLMMKLYMNAKPLESIQSYLIFDAWKLPQNHYFATSNTGKNTGKRGFEMEEKKNDNIEKDSECDELYSVWTSLWNASVIGDKFLNDCAEKIDSIDRNRSVCSFEKLFGCEKGQCDLDLREMRDQLLASADSYGQFSM